MSGSIFHTSHGGSTLLAYLLFPYAKVYSEPSWTHNLIAEKKYADRIKTEPGYIVKYPSALCSLAPRVEGPKVFLYRRLGEHLVKVNANTSSHYVDCYYDYHRTYCHPLIEHIPAKNLLQKHIFMWLNNFLWAKESDALFIKSFDFLSNTELEFKKVCKHFDINPDKKFFLPWFNVKHAGFIHQDLPLGELKSQKEIPVKPSEGVIPKSVIENSSTVKISREWVCSQVNFDPEFL